MSPDKNLFLLKPENKSLKQIMAKYFISIAEINLAS